MCLICYVLSLIFANGSGNYIFTLFDNYSGNIPLLIIALFECIAVAYVYGVKRYVNDKHFIALCTCIKIHQFPYIESNSR